MTAESNVAAIGASVGCPFCKARQAGSFTPGELAFVVSGPDVGRWGKVGADPAPMQLDGLIMHFDWTEPSASEFCSKQTSRLLRLDDLSCPQWMPPLRLADASRIEDFVFSFCAAGKLGSDFVWRNETIQWLVVAVWWNMFPVNAEELSALAIAHGMPSHFQRQLEEAFEFGRGCLVAGNKRKPRPSWRREGEISEQFTEALRRSYYWDDAR